MASRILPDRNLTGAEKAARYKLRHPDRARASRKKSREKYAAKIKAYMTVYREKNRECLLKYSREYEHGRKQSRPAVRRATYAANPEKYRDTARKWKKKNPDQQLVDKLQHRANKRKAHGSHTRGDLKDLLERQNYLCANPHCFVDLRAVVRAVDHIVSLAKGGSNFIANLQWLCRPCNSRKTTLSQDEWLKRESQRKRIV